MTTSILPLNLLAGAVRLDDSLPGWTLLERSDKPESARSFTTRIAFERAFGSRPVVHLGIIGFDMDNGDNARLEVNVTAVDNKGFSVELRTWWNSRLWSVNLSWLAIGN
jgi:hypothetical protein